MTYCKNVDKIKTKQSKKVSKYEIYDPSKSKKKTVKDVGCILYDNILNFQYIFKNFTTFLNLNFF